MADDARRVLSEEAEEVVFSRMYSITSHVCKVASGANETRRLAVAYQHCIHGEMCPRPNIPRDLRLASRLFASSSFEGRIDLTTGANDCT